MVVMKEATSAMKRGSRDIRESTPKDAASELRRFRTLVERQGRNIKGIDCIRNLNCYPPEFFCGDNNT
jgi:hypothetical protein